MKIDISIKLDKRRLKKNGTYPVKIRVYDPSSQETKMYSTKYSYTESDFQKIWINKKTFKVYKEDKAKLESILIRAKQEAETLREFNFDVFDKLLRRKKGDGQNVFYHYLDKIQELRTNQQERTAENYESSMKSLKAYIQYLTKKENPEQITYYPLTKIDRKWLQAYERYMINQGSKSTTIGIYLRPLRHIFNRAKSQNEISSEEYPFGKGKYIIQEPEETKRALSSSDLSILKNANPANPHQRKALDFWLFKFATMGMNNKDILLLKHSDLQEDKFSYYRSKTKNTSKKPKKITVYLNDFSKNIIEKYKVENSEFVFGYLDKSQSTSDQVKIVKNFTKYVNQHIKKLAISVGVTGDISNYWARHSFATKMIREGASIEFISEAFDHKNLNTTKRYFNGFEDEAKKEFSKKIMDF